MKVNVVKNIVASAIFALATFAGISASANTGDLLSDSSNGNVDIRYAGTNDDFFNFEVSVRNADDKKLTLRILDQNGIELYREVIGKRDYSKFVKVIRNDYSRLNFVIDAQNGQYKKTFRIQSEVLEQVSVVEIN
jgi:hypothetical protein